MVRRCSLVALAGSLMTATTLAAPLFDAKWTQLVYKDAGGKEQSMDVVHESTQPGYHGWLGIFAVAVNNDVVFKGDYVPTGGRAVVKVTIREWDTNRSNEYSGMGGRGQWAVTVPKGKLAVATVYDITVEVTIDGRPQVRRHIVNVANN